MPNKTGQNKRSWPDKIYKSEHTHAGNKLKVKILENQGGKVQIRVAVAKKTGLRAVERNKLKRLIREIFKKNLKELIERRNVLVTIYQIRKADKKSQEIKKIAEEAFNRASVLFKKQ